MTIEPYTIMKSHTSMRLKEKNEEELELFYEDNKDNDAFNITTKASNSESPISPVEHEECYEIKKS
jgi:hypothetical protein